MKTDYELDLLTKKISDSNFIRNLTGLLEKDKTTHLDSVYLVGGAVIDILEGRCVKDYDLLILPKAEPEYLRKSILLKLLLESGGMMTDETSTALSIDWRSFTIQILKKDLSSFDFTISTSRYSIGQKKLILDYHCFENKLLLPVSFDKVSCLNTLRRIPHWLKKGYHINEKTYQSLLNILSSITPINS